MGANEKAAAAYHPDDSTASEHLCRDCGSSWTSQSAADECEILDAVETRNARRTRG